MDYYDWKPYVPVAARRARAALQASALAKKGQPTSPVVIDGRKIAKTFWGKAWCDNLERYSDYANRLPRGRTYVRNGSVIDLQVAPGVVTAMVIGSDLYRIEVKVAAVPKAHWSAVCTDCAGAIDSLVELLQGRFSTGVMARICHEKTGLFPSPAEITFSCSCPDWASMCKHVAAVLYGIGARLDEMPHLLFALRKVDHQDLIAQAGTGLTQTTVGEKAERVLEGDLSEMFGIEIAQAAPPPATAVGKKRALPAEPAAPKAPVRPANKAPARTSVKAVRPKPFPAAKWAAIAERVKENRRATRRKAKSRR